MKKFLWLPIFLLINNALLAINKLDDIEMTVDIKIQVDKFIAIKDIEIGEELLHDYGKMWWSKRKELKLI